MIFFAALSIILFLSGYGDNDWKITLSTICACLAFRHVHSSSLILIASLACLGVIAISYPNLNNTYSDIASFILITTITAKTLNYIKKTIHKSNYTRTSIAVFSNILLALAIVAAFFTYSSQAFLLGLSIYLILFAIFIQSPPNYTNYKSYRWHYKSHKNKYQDDVVDVDYSETSNHDEDKKTKPISKN